MGSGRARGRRSARAALPGSPRSGARTARARRRRHEPNDAPGSRARTALLVRRPGASVVALLELHDDIAFRRGACACHAPAAGPPTARAVARRAVGGRRDGAICRPNVIVTGTGSPVVSRAGSNSILAGRFQGGGVERLSRTLLEADRLHRSGHGDVDPEDDGHLRARERSSGGKAGRDLLLELRRLAQGGGRNGIGGARRRDGGETRDEDDSKQAHGGPGRST